MRKLLMSLSVATALSGCGAGFPLGHATDPDATQTLSQSEPLVAECRKQFAADIHGPALAYVGGPTVARDGTLTTVRLEADSATSATTLKYECAFENNTLGSHGVLR